jgi:hypothetical protein
MTDEPLAAQILLVLSQAKGTIAIKTGPGSTTTLADVGSTIPDVSAIVHDSETPGEAVSEHLDLLRVLYSSTDGTLRETFWETLTHDSLWYAPDCMRVIAHLMVELRSLDRICIPLFRWDQNYNSATVFWNAIRAKLSFQAPLFSDADLGVLNEKIEATAKALPRSKDSRGVDMILRNAWPLSWELQATVATITRIRYLRLRQRLLSSENPELNTDQKELLSRVHTLGFPGDVSTALEEVERKIRSAGTPLDFKGCMDLLRTIFERIFQESALKVASKTGRAAPSGPSVGNFQPFKQYLVNEKLLSEDESKVVQGVFNYVSNTGTHKLGSDVEQVRVTKNTLIEWSLMIVGRVQGLLATP